MTTSEQQQGFEGIDIMGLRTWLDAPERVSTDVKELDRMLFTIRDRDEAEFLLAFQMAEGFYEKAMRNTGNNRDSFMSREMMTYLFSFGFKFEYFFKKNLAYFVAFCGDLYSEDVKRRFKTLFGYGHDQVKNTQVPRLFADILYVLESDAMDAGNGEAYRLDGMEVRRLVVEGLGGNLLTEFDRLLADAREHVRVNNALKGIVSVTSSTGFGWLEGYIKDETLPEEIREMASERMIELKVNSIRRKVGFTSRYLKHFEDEDPLLVIDDNTVPLREQLAEYESASEDSVDERILTALRETIAALDEMKDKISRERQ